MARTPDKHGNVIAEEGCTRCACGCKYWENDRCVDCGSAPVTPKITTVMAHPGHYAVEGTTHWVSRNFDGYAVVSPKGEIVAEATVLIAAAAIALALA